MSLFFARLAPGLQAVRRTSALAPRAIRPRPSPLSSATAHHAGDYAIGNIRVALAQYGGEVLPLRAIAIVEELQSTKWKLNLFDASISHDVRDQINTLCSGLKAYFDSSLKALVVTTKRPQLASERVARRGAAVTDPHVDDLELFSVDAPRRAHVKAKPNMRAHEARSVLAATSVTQKEAARLEKQLMSSRRSRRQAIRRATQADLEHALFGLDYHRS